MDENTQGYEISNIPRLVAPWIPCFVPDGRNKLAVSKKTGQSEYSSVIAMFDVRDPKGLLLTKMIAHQYNAGGLPFTPCRVLGRSAGHHFGPNEKDQRQAQLCFTSSRVFGAT